MVAHSAWRVWHQFAEGERVAELRRAMHEENAHMKQVRQRASSI